MKEITLNELKKLQIDMLNYIKKICEENNLNYYLAYGTLLGAVRHKGFIPWDDYIDIMMPREDYKKFILAVKEYPCSFYKLISIETEDKYTLPLPKLIDTRTILIQNYNTVEKVDLGVYIDIFILDGAGNTMNEAVSIKNKSFSLFQDWYRSSMKMFLPNQSKIISILKWIKNTPYRKKGIRNYLERMKKFNSKLSFYNCKYIVMLNFCPSLKENNIWLANYFGDGVLLEFEECIFKVPCAYKEILTSIYGNYMQIPPVEERISNHDYKVYWKE